MRKRIFSLALVVALLLSSAGGRAGPVQAGINVWTQTSQGRGGRIDDVLAISPNYATDRTIFAGTQDHGLFKSTNGGDSWTQVNPGLTSLYVAALAISPNYASDNTIFAGIHGGVFKSTDGGSSWTEVTNLGVQVLVISPDYATDNTIFAGTWGGGVFKSTDGGSSWTQVNTGLTNSYMKAFAISPNYTSDNTIFAGTYFGGTFRSTNGGSSWTEVNTGLTTLDVPALVISPNYASDNTIFAGGLGVFKSTDGGDSWSQVAGLSVRALAISPDYATDNTIFAGTSRGLFKSTDGGDSWTETGLTLTRLTNGSFEQGPRIPAPWKGNKNLTFKDRRVCNNAHDGSCSFRMIGTSPYRPLGTTSNKSLRQVVRGSGNAGDTFTLSGWSKARKPLRKGGAYCLQAKVFHTDGTKGRYRACFAKRTHDWRRRKTTFTTVKAYNKIVVSLLYYKQSGTAWFDHVQLVRPPVWVRALTISPNYASDNTIFAGTSYGRVFKSTDGGDSWDLVHHRLPKSTDGGSSWSAMNAGLGSLNILALALTPTAPQTIFAGTGGRSVWQYTISENAAP